MYRFWIVILALAWATVGCDDDPKPLEDIALSDVDLVDLLLPDGDVAPDLTLDLRDTELGDDQLEESAELVDLPDLHDLMEVTDGQELDDPDQTDADDAAEQAADADADIPSWDQRYDPLVAALRRDLAAANAYGVSVAVMENGVITFAQAFGSKDPAGLDPLTPDTLMQIGSTTKQLTAAALLRKVEAGQITLDTTLGSALPGFEFAENPTWADSITMHHLLSQQSGIDDEVPWDGSPDDDGLATYTVGTFAATSFLMNPPGAFHNYSNPNFALAGAVTEALDSRPWPEIMREDLLLPLGMERTYVRKSDVEADGDYALSYGIGTNNLQTGQLAPVAMANVPDTAWTRPAGLMWTTPSQMMHWARFLIEGDSSVLSDELRGAMVTAHARTYYTYGLQQYGYGIFLDPGFEADDGRWFEMPVWQHGGATLSFSHLFYILPEQGFAIAICSSGNGDNFYHSVEVAITTLAQLPAPSPAPQWVIEPKFFTQHAGSYWDPNVVGAMDIALQGGELAISMPHLSAAGYTVHPRLIPLSTELFLGSIDGHIFDFAMIPQSPGGDTQWVRNRLFVTTRLSKQDAVNGPGDLSRWTRSRGPRLGPGVPREIAAIMTKQP